MPSERPTKNDRFFSVELNSKNQIKSISLTNGAKNEDIIIEGTIGNLIQASFTEGIMLEVIGEKGILRLDLQEQEITKPKETFTKTAINGGD